MRYGVLLLLLAAMAKPGYADVIINDTSALPVIRTWRPGDDVNNGGGLAEKTFVRAFSSMEKYLSICLTSQACRLSERDRRILTAIKESHSLQAQGHGGLMFASEKEEPGTFLIDGELKVAKTGAAVGAPIYINQDLIYAKGPEGTLQPMGLGEAVSVLVHELGHHQGEMDHTYLDVLGNKVALLLQHHVSESPLLPFNTRLSLIVVNGDSGKDYPQILLNVFDQQYDLTQQFADKMKCHFQLLPLPIIDEISVREQKPLGVVIHNVHWTKFSDDPDQRKFVLEGNLTKFCEEGSTFKNTNKDHRARFTFELEKIEESDSWSLKADSLEIKDKYDPWWKFIKLPF
ncbi:MAG: hypothetical protein H6624_01710 [Bdellovibrionaceae bacterium]|nr:hypothetical protein [Bdellovibrionales bacterium]MCB9083024.1 hypothetical protein [Pseudobdellovibrionaceae bacterium]